MKIPIHLAEKLLQLMQGEVLPASSVKHVIIEEMIIEGVIERKGRIKKSLSVSNPNTLKVYLQNKHLINDLEQYILISQQENITRSDAIEISGNSKLKKIRTFKGFLVNCFNPIQATLNGKSIILNPEEGTFQFIYDFESFVIPKDCIVIGVENSENFRYIERQKHLFENVTSIFVSRYPQNQNKDLINWLQSVPNQYLHFGDFDFAGIGIYLNEYKKYLGDRATFYIPENIGQIIQNYGNKYLYDKQNINFDLQSINEENLINLIGFIHKYKKGLEQEVLINFSSCKKS